MISVIWRRFNQFPKYIWLGKLLLSMLSGAATGLGLAIYLNSVLGNQFKYMGNGLVENPQFQTMIQHFPTVLAVLLTLIIQGMILNFWGDFFGKGEQKFRQRLGALAMAVMASAISITFAAGGQAGLIDTSNVIANSMKPQQAAVAAFSNETRLMADEMTRLASLARNKATVEKKNGGTCTNTRANPKPRCGRICRMRMRQSEKLDKFAVLSRRFSDKAARIASTLREGRFAPDAVSRADNIRQSMRNDPVIGNMIAWLGNEAKGFSSEFFDVKTGKAFVCRDPGFSNSIEAALNRLRKTRTLLDQPLVSPGIGDILPLAVNYTLERVWSAFSSFDLYRLPRTFWSAFLIDVAIVLMAFWEIQKRPVIPGEGGVWPVLNRRQKKQLERDASLLPFLYPVDKRNWVFLAPVDGDPVVTERARSFAVRHGFQEHPDIRIPVDLTRILPHWVEALAEYHRGAMHFKVYKAPKDSWEKLNSIYPILEANATS